jgi:hypothetical protein
MPEIAVGYEAFWTRRKDVINEEETVNHSWVEGKDRTSMDGESE